MHSITKVWRIFLSLPQREKLFIIILSAVFVISLAQYFIVRPRHIASSDSVFTEGIVGRFKYLNPLFADFNDADRDASKLIFSGLIRYDPVAKNFFPDLAETFERSGNMEYTVKLRSNAQWHDGVSVTADDVIFTFATVIQGETFRNIILRNSFEGVRVVKKDEHTITFTLPRPNSYFISNLTVGLLPAHIFGTLPFNTIEKTFMGQAPIGSGPYKVTDVRLSNLGDSIDLERFSGYYGSLPALETMRLVTFPTETALLEEAKALKSVAKLPEKSPVIAEVSADETTAYPYTLNQFVALYFNTQNPILSDTNVRRAIGHGINKDALLEEGQQRVDTIGLSSQPENPVFAFDAQKSEQLFSKRLFDLGADSLRRTNTGDVLRFSLLALEGTSQKLLESLQKQLLAIGVPLDIETLPAGEFMGRVQKRAYDILLMKQNLGYNRDVYPLFHSSQIDAAGLNFSNFKSFRTDGLTEAIRKETVPADKEKLLQELSRVLAQEAPAIFLSTPIYVYLLPSALTRFPVTSLDFHADRFAIIPYLK